MPDIAKLDTVIAKHDAPPTGAESSPDADAGRSPPGAASGEDSAPAELASALGPADTSVPDPAAEERSQRLALQAAKLQRLKQKNAAARELARVRELEEKAAEASKSAAEERERWAKLGKDGSFLEAIKAAGRDPREVFEEMQQEALRAGTPEAQLASVREALEKDFASKLEPLQKQLAEIAAERDALRQRTEQHAFESDFRGTIADDAYAPLREEYPREGTLLAIAASMRDNPELLYRQAEAVGVDLTRRGGRFTMRDILDVLRATQAEHEAQKMSRTGPAAPLAPAATPAQRIVNGTAERRGGTFLGNDLASETATERPRMTRAQRVERAIKKFG